MSIKMRYIGSLPMFFTSGEVYTFDINPLVLKRGEKALCESDDVGDVHTWFIPEDPSERDYDIDMSEFWEEVSEEINEETSEEGETNEY